MSSVQQLKPKPTERAALAAAIREYNDAVESLNRVKEAKEAAIETGHRAWSALKAAEAALESARATEGSRLAAVALGEASDTASVAEAELALTQAKNDRTVIQNTMAALGVREEAEQRVVEAARRERDDARRAVVWADEATHALVAQYHAVQKSYLDLCKLLAALQVLGCNPLKQFGEGYAPEFNFISQGPAPAAPMWEAAITALLQDANAALPTA